MSATTTYKYTARDRSGNVQSGTLAAETSQAAASKLRGLGVAPISLEEIDKSGLQRDITLPGFGPKVGLRDLAIFARQFATMISSGLSLIRALNILADQADNKELARVLNVVRGDVEEGRALSAALGEHKPFPKLFLAMVRAGEAAGMLDTVLLRIAGTLEADLELRGKIKSAMTYPVVVLIMALGLTAAMLVFIVPVFAGMFSSLGGELPLPTRLLMVASNAIRQYWYAFLAAPILLWQLYKRVNQVPPVRLQIDRFKLKVPVFGPLFHKVALSRFTRNLGGLLKAGVPILSALEITADTLNNQIMARALEDVKASVREGESVAGPLTNHPVFPAMVVQMVSVGEETGAIDVMLEKIADFYDTEVAAATEQLTAMLEPLMIAVLGTIVGGMVIALYMPMFKIFDLIN